MRRGGERSLSGYGDLRVALGTCVAILATDTTVTPGRYQVARQNRGIGSRCEQEARFSYGRAKRLLSPLCEEERT